MPVIFALVVLVVLFPETPLMGSVISLYRGLSVFFRGWGTFTGTLEMQMRFSAAPFEVVGPLAFMTPPLPPDGLHINPPLMVIMSYGSSMGGV